MWERELEGLGSRALWESGYSSAEEVSFEAVAREEEPQRKRKGKEEEGGERRRSRKKKERKTGRQLSSSGCSSPGSVKPTQSHFSASKEPNFPILLNAQSLSP